MTTSGSRRVRPSSLVATFLFLEMLAISHVFGTAEQDDTQHGWDMNGVAVRLKRQTPRFHSPFDNSELFKSQNGKNNGFLSDLEDDSPVSFSTSLAGFSSHIFNSAVSNMFQYERDPRTISRVAGSFPGSENHKERLLLSPPSSSKPFGKLLTSHGAPGHALRHTPTMKTRVQQPIRPQQGPYKNKESAGGCDSPEGFHVAGDTWFGNGCRRRTCVHFRGEFILETDSCNTEIFNPAYKCIIQVDTSANFPQCCPTYTCNPDSLGNRVK